MWKLQFPYAKGVWIDLKSKLGGFTWKLNVISNDLNTYDFWGDILI